MKRNTLSIQNGLRMALVCIGLLPSSLAMQAAPSNSNIPPAGWFLFRTPNPVVFNVGTADSLAATAATDPDWVTARAIGSGSETIELGRRLVVQLKADAALAPLLANGLLQLSRTIAPNLFIVEAKDLNTALIEAQRLSACPEVLVCHPVMRHDWRVDGKYAPVPADPYYWYENHLENRPVDYPVGVDLNVRSAWPYTRGEGVTLAVADMGVELNHYELAPRALPELHHNFDTGTTNGLPFGSSAAWAHGTEVSGLAVAEGDNNRGMVGVAPRANLASWVIYRTNGALIGQEQLMDTFQYASNRVQVQNHSWSPESNGQEGPGVLELTAISNAVHNGRDGRGMVFVRSAGNYRPYNASSPSHSMQRADDNGYANSPSVIAVGAVDSTGRVMTNFSESGACLLVAAPGSQLFTTDLLGTSRGVNNSMVYYGNPDFPDFAFSGGVGGGFTGTSASAPLVSGVAALILSANTNLTSRDVQQVLVQSSRHTDLADPDVTTNGAGLRVSHNVGYGIPDAGQAVRVAKAWPNRPPMTNVVLTAPNPVPIPDDGLRLIVTGTEGQLASIQVLAGNGPQPAQTTPLCPLVDVGIATTITANLTGKAALIQRDATNSNILKVMRAARAGASFAVVWNYSSANNDQLNLMTGMDFTSIPAVSISYNDGLALQGIIQTNASAQIQLRLQSAQITFNVTNTLVCEHVGVRLRTDHPLRGDLRITLVSPQGTTSLLQTFNLDESPGPVDWTYWSTHHFYESSVGEWTITVTDEFLGNVGSVLGASLIVEGVAIKDTDHDGLDDDWEMAHFGALNYGPKDDPDEDGYCNSREQVMGTDPMKADIPFELDVSPWNKKLARLSWPSTTNWSYQIWTGTNVAQRLTLTATMPGRFPETEWMTPYTTVPYSFYRVQAVRP